MEKLRNIEESLKELHDDFNKQVASLSTDTKEFHNSLIDLSSKYPEHKELIQFIVFVNDKLESNQHLFGEVVVEAFNGLVNSKRALVREVIIHKETHVAYGCKDRIISQFKKADIKIILIATAVIVVSVGILVDATFVAKAGALIAKLFGG